MSVKPMKVHSANPDNEDLTRCGKNRWHVTNSAKVDKVTCKRYLSYIQNESDKGVDIMQVLKYRGRRFNACAPRKVAEGKYTCDAWVEFNQRPVRSLFVLGELAVMIMKGVAKV